MNNTFPMDDNFNDFAVRPNRHTAISAREAPSRTTLGSLDNGSSMFNHNNTSWAEMGTYKMLNNASKVTYLEEMLQAQGAVIDAIKKRNVKLEQEMQELRHQVDQSTKKKTHSPCDKLLLVILVVFFI